MGHKLTSLSVILPNATSLRFLNESLIKKIDLALCKAGEFGQVRLVIVKGRLRFIEVTQSESIKDEDVLDMPHPSSRA